MDSTARTPVGVAELKKEVSKLQAVLSAADSDDDYSDRELQEIGLSNSINSHRSADFPIAGLFAGSSNENISLPSFVSWQHESTVKQCLEHSQYLKEAISKSLQKVEALEEDLLIKEKYLEEKLALSLKLEVEEKKKIKYYKPINLFATPYFRDARKSVPSPNEDSLLKRMNHDIDAYTLPPKPWTSVEHKSLRTAVIGTAKIMLMDPLITRQEYYNDRLENGQITPEQAAETKEKLKNILEEIEKVEKMSVRELLELTKSLDWMRIATAMVDNHRTPEECERMWTNYLHPSINKKKWTAEEDKELETVAKKHNFRNWSSIASKLKLSNRTAIQCLERYQSTLNKSMLKSAWSVEDDEELARVVESCKVGDYIPWNQVQYHIDGRTRLQILNRWTRAIAPDLKKTPWSSQEDAILLAAVEKYGYHWTKIQELLPGRSNFSCRERYTNVLLPNTMVGNWTPEEDRTLVKLVKRYGETKWSRIASYLPGRTDNMCLTRFTRIKKHHPHLFEECDPNGTDIEADIDEITTPTHNCKRLNNHRLAVRTTAEMNMLETVMKIKGYSSHEEAMAALGGPKTSHAFLCTLSKELLGEQQNSVERKVIPKKSPKSGTSEESNIVRSSRTSKGSNIVRSSRTSEGSNIVMSSRSSSGGSNVRSSKASRWSSVAKSFRSSSRREDIFQSTDSDSYEESFTSSSDDDNDYENYDDDVDNNEDEACSAGELSADLHAEDEERKRVESELDSLLVPVVSYKIGTPARLRGQCDSVKTILQNSLVEAYIYKQMQFPYEAGSEDTSYRGVDYAATVPLVCREFVPEASSEGRLPIIPPNPATTEAMKYLLLNHKALVNFLQEDPCENLSVLSVITSNENYTLVCSSCYMKYGYVSQPNVVVNLPETGTTEDMNGMNDESGSAGSQQCKVEPGTSSSNGSCPECERLNLLRKMYHLLRRRTLSTFLWPAILTSIIPSEEQRVKTLGQTISQPITVKNKARGKKRKKKAQLKVQKEKKVKLAGKSEHAKKRGAQNAKVAAKHTNDKKVYPLASRKSPRQRK